MSNVKTGLTWVLDTAGVISATPIWVKRAVLFPNAASDTAVFNQWFPGTGDTGRIRSTVSDLATTSGTGITSTGNFTSSNVVVGDVIKITATETGNNIGTYSIITRTNDNTIVLSETLGTNESSKLYTWTVYKGYLGMELRPALPMPRARPSRLRTRESGSRPCRFTLSAQAQRFICTFSNHKAAQYV